MAHLRLRALKSPEVKTPLPGPKSAKMLERLGRVFYSPMYGAEHVIPLVMKRKEGWFVEDVDGNTYIDMALGWSSTPLGAAHPEIMEAAIGALRRGGIECTDYIPTPEVLEFAEKLVEVSQPGLTRVSPDTTGTEAVEASMRVARVSTGRHFIISFHGAFHGGNYGAGAASPTEPTVTRDVSQYVNGIIHVPYPYCYRCPFRLNYPSCGLHCLEGYFEDNLLRYQVAPDLVAGVLFEPIEGENGVIIPPPEYTPRLRALCDKYGWLLIADEVQTGFGRCGRMFAMELTGVEPDLVPLAKSITGGAIPIAAVLGTEEAMGSLDYLYLGGTFAFQPAACAAGLKFLEIMERDRVLDNVASLEKTAREKLRPLAGKYEIVGDVRIQGVYMGVEFVESAEKKGRAGSFGDEVARLCAQKGLVMLHEQGQWWIRPTPANNMPPEIFAKGCDIIEESISEVSEKHRMGIA